MKKYQGLEHKLSDVGVYFTEEVRVVDEEKVSLYQKLSEAGKDLPEGVIKREYQRSLGYGGTELKTSFYQKQLITDDHVKALIEIEQTRSLRSIARSMRFFCGTCFTAYLVFVFKNHLWGLTVVLNRNIGFLLRKKNMENKTCFLSWYLLS